MTHSAPVAETVVPEPTAARTVGELIACPSAPVTLPSSDAPPSEARAKAGATTVGELSPMTVL